MLLMALLALAWSSDRSTRGLALLLLYAASIGGRLAGMPSTEASPSLMLAWDDVSIGGTVTSNFWGGDVVATDMVIFSKQDCSDSWLDNLATPCSRSQLTSAVILPSGLGGDLLGLVVGSKWILLMGRSLASDSILGGMLISQIWMFSSDNAYTAT